MRIWHVALIWGGAVIGSWLTLYYIMIQVMVVGKNVYHNVLNILERAVQ
jgi:hypothetical protein